MRIKKTACMFIAIILCMSMILSLTMIAAGEEFATEPATSTVTTQPGSTASEPAGSQPTEPETTPSEPVDPPTTEPGTTPSEPVDPPVEEPEDTTMKVSDELLRVLKQLEGFEPYAYWDYKQYSIGYGSKCPEGMESYYQKNPITEEYAEELLRKELDYFEEKINDFITRNNLTLAQHQYDALVSFTYNTGANWTNGTTGNFNSAVISGDTGSHFIYGLMLWSMAGNRHILVNRRIVEMNIYANGIYAENALSPDAIPDRYRIAFMDGNGGVVKYDEHGFDAEQPIPIKTKFNSYPKGPDENGNTVTYVLDGWYTQRVGGTKVEMLDTAIPTGTVLYAHWKTPSGTPVIIPRQETGLKVTVTVTGNNVNVRSGPDTYYASMFKAIEGDVLVIEEVVSRGSLLWGRCGDLWIALKYTNYDDVLKERLPMQGKITANTLNVRTGAGTDYALVEGAQKVKGDLVLITEWKTDGTMMWGKIAEGWIALPYVTFDLEDAPDETVQSIEITKQPDKLSYIHKIENLDLTGAKLLVTYADGSTATVDITMEMISGFDNTNIGANTVTVTYEGQTVTFEVQIIKAKVVFQLDDGTIISEKEYLFGDIVEIPTEPTKSADNTYTYVFAGWDQEVVLCAGNAVYTATFTQKYIDYTVKFENEDGTVISEQTYHWGDTITVPADPVKPADNTYTYAFAGWDKTVETACSGNATYVASYKSTYIEYTVTFQHEDGTVIQQFTLHYGDPVTPPENPAVPDGYAFIGWDKNVTACEGNATYTAVLTKNAIPGDLDGNEEVNTDDVFKLLLHVSLPDMFPVNGNADFTNDGAITTDDVFRLLLHISLPDMFPL